MKRLNALDGLPQGVARPGYDPAAHGEGIVHLGLGAFHKAHQAVYTDAALAARGEDWRIAGVSLRSAEAAASLRPQNGLYTLMERGQDGTRTRIIGAISRALAFKEGDREATLAALEAPQTRIVSITVTEKGYGLDRATGGADPAHPAIAADLKTPENPGGLAGLIVHALSRRRAAGHAPFTVLSCDNLPGNGALTRGLIVDFARRIDPELADFIAAEVAFPSTMVDRITPAATPETFADAARLTGREDLAAVETESFSQWVIEDHFPQGRPEWEAGGALFTRDVAPYELMKLRMLNGAHSLLAYAGYLSGHRYVRDVMENQQLAALVRRHLSAAAATLSPLSGVNFETYADELVSRFRNPHLNHETYQIAMDGTEKLPQRLLAPAGELNGKGMPCGSFAFAVAAWMRYAMGKGEDGRSWSLRDPREAEIGAALAGCATADSIVTSLLALPGLFPEGLRDSPEWRNAVQERLALMLEKGMAEAIEAELRAGQSAGA